VCCDAGGAATGGAAWLPPHAAVATGTAARVAASRNATLGLVLMFICVPSPGERRGHAASYRRR
jgi:hypothetical protein